MRPDRARAFLVGLAALALLADPAPAQTPSPSPAATADSPSAETYVFGGSDRSPPYQYLDEAGVPQGFNPDLIRALARVSGRKIDIQLGRWTEALDEVTSGRVDLLSVAYTESRLSRFAYLAEIWTIRQSVLFLPGRESYPTNLMELGPEKVAVQEGSLTSDLLMALPEATRPMVMPARDHAAAIAMLRSGAATAVAGNSLVLNTALAKLGFRGVREVTVKATSYQLATANGREKEMAWVAEGLKKLRDSGEFSRIAEKHLAEPQPSRTWRDYALIAGSIFGASAIGILLVLSWNRTLKAQVAARTAQIAEASAEKDRLARSLADREQRMRMLVEQMPAVLWSADLDLNITSAFGRGITTLGLATNRIVDRPMAPVLGEIGLGDDVLAAMRVGLEGKASDIQGQIGAHDVEIHIEPLHDLKGDIAGLVGITVDISESKRAARALEMKNAELERFAYTVSHDLKSPLITIRGYLGHMEKSAAEGDMVQFREDAARVHKAASKMEDLLRDLLELSRIGRVLNPDEDVPMSVAAQDAADLVRGPLLKAGIRLEIESNLDTVRGDRQRLVEVLQNLLENAIKFMGDQKDPKVRVGMRRNGAETVFFVSDNGIGIDPKHGEKVFGLFEKLTVGTEGTGVGLALVKRIVEAHDGRVWVESEGVGRGSTFCFTLRPST